MDLLCDEEELEELKDAKVEEKVEEEELASEMEDERGKDSTEAEWVGMVDEEGIS